MKWFLSLMLALTLAGGIALPATASAQEWGARHAYHRGGYPRGGGAEEFLPGLIFGAVGGLILGEVLGAHSHAVPTPAYVTPPPPVCSSRPGYWTQAPVTDPGGYSTYQNVWVPPQNLCG